MCMKTIYTLWYNGRNMHGQSGLLTEWSFLIQDSSYWMFTTWAVFFSYSSDNKKIKNKNTGDYTSSGPDLLELQYFCKLCIIQVYIDIYRLFIWLLGWHRVVVVSTASSCQASSGSDVMADQDLSVEGLQELAMCLHGFSSGTPVFSFSLNQRLAYLQALAHRWWCESVWLFVSALALK